MTNELEKVVAQALSLPNAERLCLVRRLLESVEPEANEDVERAWEDEIERRIAKIDAGLVEARPWEDIKKDFGSRFGR